MESIFPYATLTRETAEVFESSLHHKSSEEAPLMTTSQYIERLQSGARSVDMKAREADALVDICGFATAIKADFRLGHLDPIINARFRYEHMCTQAWLYAWLETIALNYSHPDPSRRGDCELLLYLSQYFWRMVLEGVTERVTFIELGAGCEDRKRQVLELELGFANKRRDNDFARQRMVYHAMVAALEKLVELPGDLQNRFGAWLVWGVYEAMGPGALLVRGMYSLFLNAGAGSFSGGGKSPSLAFALPRLYNIMQQPAFDTSTPEHRALTTLVSCIESAEVPGQEGFRLSPLPRSNQDGVLFASTSADPPLQLGGAASRADSQSHQGHGAETTPFPPVVHDKCTGATKTQRQALRSMAIASWFCGE